MYLDDKITQDNFFKRVYKEEWATMINNLSSATLATLVAAGATYVAKKQGVDSDVALVSIATATDMGTYWTSLLGQFFLRDKEKMKEDGKYVVKKVTKTVAGYLGMFGVVTATYGALRGVGQYLLQKMDVDPVTASWVTQAGLTMIYTGALPMLRYGINKLSDKVSKH